ncbi:IclR family transcriptional regulator [Spelaeicoccus albus]|uniref:Glycerol operon regulatory protein n=2 Tax=Spelaeicoccus albus TaxID=1280376 RepID=A0A7Z0AAR0_9MICO|nr:DNA-binding IclR family transcriptional regulator [Spelaeicoccus albus]
MRAQPMAGDTPASVLPRALRLLEQFSDRRRALTLSELSRRSGLAPATVFRLLGHLTDWGALERLPSGQYVVGVRLWEIASLAPRGNGLRQVALPYLEDLYEVTRHHVLLTVVDRGDGVLIDRLSGRAATEVAYRVGGRMPLRSTAGGRVLLAYSNPGFVESVLAAPADTEPGMPVIGADETRRVLADARRQGAAVVRRSAPSKTVAVAAPIFDRSGEIAAALSIVVPGSNTRVHAFIALVRTSARTISRSLGAPT